MATIKPLKAVFSVGSVPRLYSEDPRPDGGGGVEYLHRDPACRKKRRNGKSQSETVKYGREYQGNSDQRNTALARASSIHKRQARPLVREGAPQKQARDCQIVIAKYLAMSPRWGSTPRLTD
jgi:hypothetical protein